MLKPPKKQYLVWNLEDEDTDDAYGHFSFYDSIVDAVN